MTGPSPLPKPASPPLEAFERPQPDGLGAAELVAIALSLVWLAAVAVLYLFAPGEGAALLWAQQTLGLLAVMMPLVMIWVAAIALRAARVMRAEGQRLQAAIDGLRTAYVTHAQQHAAVAEPSVTKKLEEIAETARKTETALATFHTSRRNPPRPAIPQEAAEMTAAGQGTLALGTPAAEMAPPLPTEQFIRALNFPETAEDEEGFAALRLALKDRKAAQVIQAAQDVLTLLSQDGIYMDDLRPDMARPEIWRQFAQGARGRAVAALGGIRDRTSLALTAARMKQDPIFRDAAHHFLRRFDQMFADFEGEASDGEISALGNTRTARAFMLLGRVAGTFD
ncbi:hypothetical protein ACUXV3_10200 [Roseobacteraceae bacterium NS-SX3]